MSECKPCGIGPQDETPTENNFCEPAIRDIDSVGFCLLDENGNPIQAPTGPDTDSGCVERPNGLSCPKDALCDIWDLTKTNESCVIEGYVEESLNIGAAEVFVYKLMGVYEQTLLVDQIGAGEPISSGSLAANPPAHAFDVFITEWRSSHVGSQVVASSYLGYDFGPIMLNTGRHRYGIETYIKKDVTKIRIKQGCDSKNRATRIRLERSSDGQKWYGVDVFDVQDCDGMIEVNVRRTVPSRWWRIRPVQFNGGPDDYWAVKALQLIDYEETAINNIQDRIFLENRDRQYDTNAKRMKAAYIPIDVVANQSKFAFNPFSDQYSLEVSFKSTLANLGRPFVIGDIIELTPETQYTTTLRPVKKYVEVIDVAWSTNGYTPNWVPTMQRLLCRPALASQETQDIFGKLTGKTDENNVFDLDDGSAAKYQDDSTITQTIEAKANTAVPQDGTDYANVPELSQELKDYAKKYPGMDFSKFARNRNVYGIDAMPPNGLPYTEGETFPSSPSDGDYHRLTYDSVRKGIPPRLYRYSVKKAQWVYLETDHRFFIKNAKSLIEEFRNENSSSVTPVNKIDKKLNP